MAVLVEHGGFGAAAAAPIARDCMTYLYDPTKATDALVKLEAGWGGDVPTRMARAAAGFAQAQAAVEPGAENAQDSVQ